MEVILVDDVFELGKRGELVRVADGYGRNYLIPKKLAITATKGNQKMIEQQRLSLAKQEAKYKEDADILATEVNQLHLLVSRKCGETGTLFGSVTSKDITSLLQQTGIALDRRKVHMNQPIKSIGNYQIPLRLHSEVATELLVSVLSEGDEPVATVKRKDEESEAIVAELEAEVAEAQQVEVPPPAEPAQDDSESTDSLETSSPEEPTQVDETSEQAVVEEPDEENEEEKAE